MFEKFKDFIGINEEYDDYEDDNEMREEEKKEENIDNTYTPSSTYDYKTSTNLSDTSSVYSSYSNNYSSNNQQRKTRGGDNILSMNDSNKNFSQSSSSRFRISIQEPISYDEDGPKIVDDILDKKVVVLNLEMLEVDKKRQILDFVSGAVYALDGKVEKVSKGIFVICPKGIDIDNYVEDQISTGNYNQL
ncbi:cell division protein SepF [Anaerococcus sp. AGMB00486]|uniref:Cell division protein SepF n=2 Tax=Anaerococcus TaxID=165779 RepID=A0ABX2N7I0_9FIRM|nr:MULTISPECIES: cell division protein SepF [Anaerococcus]MDY3005458.1 cell division protein SepF [Anaerococcus porci]MSS76886.1 cell division protein SepF [Anaerococcus porci]NVF10630.1 cell division protein SepF [Anaerococcus faecalis]